MGEAGSAGVSRTGRFFNEIRSMTAHASTDPKRTRAERVPTTRRCANAQALTATSIGWRKVVRTFPGKYAANTPGNTGSKSAAATQRRAIGATHSTCGVIRVVA